MPPLPAPEPWPVVRLDELVDRVARALPDEELGADDLAACTFEDDGVVLGTDDGVAAVVRRGQGALVAASVQLVVVEEAARRRGVGSRLLQACEGWAREAGAVALTLGGAAPWYLWPGVDVTDLPAQCLAEANGFTPIGCELNVALDVAFRAEPPPGVRVARVIDEDEVVAAFVAERWPHWSDEAGRAVEHGTCFAAWVGDEVVGFVGHSINRLGWLGPMGTDPARQGGGIGAALVSAVCLDLQVAGRRSVEVAWVGPVRFYAKLGARPSRAFRTYQRLL